MSGDPKTEIFAAEIQGTLLPQGPWAEPRSTGIPWPRCRGHQGRQKEVARALGTQHQGVTVGSL